MTDRKRTQANDDMDSRQTIEAASRLDEALGKLDSYAPGTPDDQWFELFVKNEQRRLKKKHQKELVLFLLCALLILSGVLFAMAELPQFFLALQGAAAVFTLLYSYRGSKKQVDGQ